MKSWRRGLQKPRKDIPAALRKYPLGFVAFLLLLALPDCQSTGIGLPCTPDQEYSEAFVGFDPGQVVIESRSFQCPTRVCLVHHFQGRTGCPYGQGTTGLPPQGALACLAPLSNKPISGKNGKEVKPWCADRTPQDAVYCSCRCANVEGKTDDGANYCPCPQGFVCAPLVASIGAGEEGLTGSYCIREKTEYDQEKACTTMCNPTTNPCAQEGNP